MQEEIKKACQIMAQGGIILYPTDTVWGIGCDATNEDAIKRIYALKQREDSKALLVLVDNAVKIDFYIDNVPEITYDLVELATKPLTIIYPNARNLASNLIAEDGSIGIRVTNEKFSQSLCQRFRKAIVSTSANISGYPTPMTFAEIPKEIKQGVDYIVQYRQEEMLLPSPSGIIKVGEGGLIQVIRE